MPGAHQIPEAEGSPFPARGGDIYCTLAGHATDRPGDAVRDTCVCPVLCWRLWLGRARLIPSATREEIRSCVLLTKRQTEGSLSAFPRALPIFRPCRDRKHVGPRQRSHWKARETLKKLQGKSQVDTSLGKNGCIDDVRDTQEMQQFK